MHKPNLPHNHGENIDKVLEALPRAEEFLAIADLFRLLGDASRIKIFWFLCHARECVINLSAVMEMSSPAVSHHLKQLKSAGLIVSQREGKEVYYKAADTLLAKTLHNMLETVSKVSCPDGLNYINNETNLK